MFFRAIISVSGHVVLMMQQEVDSKVDPSVAILC